MFNKMYEDRLNIWSKFRQTLEKSTTPFEDTIAFFNDSPYTSISADPWDRNTWPTPWEMIHENLYCDFTRVLAWCYSLQLTERFSNSNFEIHIITAEEKSYQYVLHADDFVLGFIDNVAVKKDKLPKNYQPQQVHQMPKLQ